MRAGGRTRLAAATSLLVTFAYGGCGFDGAATGPEPIVPPPVTRTDAPPDVVPEAAPIPDAAPDAREAGLAEFCAKCAECVEVISDDFCDPYITVGATKTFDLAGCSANGKLPPAKAVPIAQLAAWTCKDFDDHM